MIDTIILRINNLSKYNQLYEQYFAPSQKKNTTTVAQIDKDSGEIKEFAKTNAYIFHDTNRFLPLTHRSNINIASSHYSLSYQINTTLDFLEFNFSIPKYLYSTNVLQFIDLYNQDTHTTYLKLFNFITNFIEMNMIQKPLFEDVEINRLDLCYNQMFNTKSDALQYLDEQKKLLVKYARSSKNNYRSYDTSLMYITTRYSFKIYHKGTEFKKNDYKQLVKANNPKNLPLQYFLDESDKMLRYEMTFRKSQINYLLQHYFYVSKNSALHEKYNDYYLVKFNKRLINQIGVKQYDKHKKRSKQICLSSAFNHTNDIEILYNSSAVNFDETLFTILHNEFYFKIKQYQLNQKLSVAEVIDAIKTNKDNTKLKNQLRRKPLTAASTYRMVSAALLSQYINIDELKKLLPEPTFYRLKSDLKKVGITSNQTELQIPTPRTDYFDYLLSFGKFYTYA